MQDIRRQLVIGLRWLPLIVVCAVLAGGVAYAYSSSQPKVYEAVGTLWVDPGQDYGLTDLAVAGAAAVRYAEEASSPLIATAVAEELGLQESPRSLAGRIATETSEETLELKVATRDRDPDDARVLALTVGNLMVERVGAELITPQVKATDNSIGKINQTIRDSQRRLRTLQQKTPKAPEDRSEIIQLTGLLASLRSEVDSLRPGSSAYVRNLLEWRARPRMPTEPVEPRPLYWTLLAVVVGGMAAAALAFVLEYLLFGRKVRDERDLEETAELPVLGSVTERRGDIRVGGIERLVTLRYPSSGEAEAYKSLVANIGFADGSARTLLVASPGETDERSVVAANIALAYAEASRDVILVDADFSSPRLHQFFDVPNDHGLSNLLSVHSVPLGWVTVPTAHPRLGLIPAGPPPTQTGGSLSGPLFNGLMRRLSHAADMVVFAGPSIKALDCAVLASHLEGSVFVVPAGASIEEVATGASSLKVAQATLVGAVLYRQVRGRHPRRSAAKLIEPAVGFRPKPEPDTSPKQIPAVVKVETPPEQGSRQGPLPPPPASTGNGRRPHHQSTMPPPPQAAPPPYAVPPPQAAPPPYAVPPPQAAPPPYAVPPPQAAPPPYAVPPPQAAPPPDAVPPPQAAPPPDPAPFDLRRVEPRR